MQSTVPNLKDHHFPADKADALNEIVGLISDWVFDQYGNVEIEDVEDDIFDADSGYRALSFALGRDACAILKLSADTVVALAFDGADLRICLTETATAALEGRSAADLAQLAADLRLYYAKCGSELVS